MIKNNLPKNFLLIATGFLLFLNAIFPSILPAQPVAVFDALIYKNKPDLAKYGMEPMRVVYSRELWGMSPFAEPKKDLIIEVAKKLKAGSLVCVDIEHWPVTGSNASAGIADYRLVASLIKQYQPTVKMGFWAVLPRSDYTRIIGEEGPAGYNLWLSENKRLQPIAEVVDAIFLQLYTHSNFTKREGWEKFAVESFKEARKYKKPVYAFLWPTYYYDNHGRDGQPIPADFWRLQLETARKHADGIVIWGGYSNNIKSHEEWDENAAWWIETKKFLKVNK